MAGLLVLPPQPPLVAGPRVPTCNCTLPRRVANNVRTEWLIKSYDSIQQ